MFIFNSVYTFIHLLLILQKIKQSIVLTLENIFVLINIGVLILSCYINVSVWTDYTTARY